MLERYGPGYIVVMAQSPGHAAIAAQQTGQDYITKDLDDRCLEGTDRAEVYGRMRKTLLKDLQPEPELIKTGVLLVPGSD